MALAHRDIEPPYKSVKRTASGEAIRPGSYLESSESERRTVLKLVGEILNDYAVAINSITRPHDPTEFSDSKAREQALIKNEVVFNAVRDKAENVRQLAALFITHCKDNNDVAQTDLLRQALNMMRNALGDPKATDQELMQAWRNLAAESSLTSNRYEFQLHLLGLFNLSPRLKEKTSISNSELVNLFKELSKHCSKVAFSLRYSDSLKAESHARQYLEIVKLLSEYINSRPYPDQPQDILALVAQKLRHLHYDHQSIPQMSDLEVIQALVVDNSENEINK